MSMISAKKGAFSQLNKDSRDLFMQGLSSIMGEAEITIIAVIIDKEKHKNKYHDPFHPYHLALMFGLERIYGFMKQNGQDGKLTHIIFEERGAKEDSELELEFRRVCDGESSMNKQLPFNIIFANKQSNSSGLQLADITARPLGLSVIRPNQPNQALDIIKSKLYAGLSNNCVEGNGLKLFP